MKNASSEKEILSCARTSSLAETPKISVVIPVYNAEAFLAECVESVLAQDFSDFELLLVDDGSTDGSGKICDAFAARDSRVRVFHETNGGASRARRIGVENARAEWIAFADSDDRFAVPSALSELYAPVADGNAEAPDLVEGEHFRFRKNPKTGEDESLPIWGNAAVNRSRGVVRVNGLDYAKEIARHEYFFTTTPWGKIIRRRLFEETNALDLPRELFHGEDTIMSFRLATKMRAALRIQKCVYFYRRNENGLCLSAENRKRSTTGEYKLAWWDCARESLQNLPAEWQEVWKLFVASTFAACFLAAKRFPTGTPRARFYFAVLRARRKSLKPLARFCLCFTRFPLSIVPSGALCFGVSLLAKVSRPLRPRKR